MKCPRRYLVGLFILTLLILSIFIFYGLSKTEIDSCSGSPQNIREKCYFDSGLCGMIIWDTFLHDQCFNKSGECENIWHSHFRDDCYMRLAISNQSTCNNINSSYGRRRCLTAIAGYFKNSSYCSQLQGEDEWVCEITSKEPAVCNEINDSYWQYECETIVNMRG